MSNLQCRLDADRSRRRERSYALISANLPGRSPLPIWLISSVVGMRRTRRRGRVSRRRNWLRNNRRRNRLRNNRRHNRRHNRLRNNRRRNRLGQDRSRLSGQIAPRLRFGAPPVGIDRFATPSAWIADAIGHIVCRILRRLHDWRCRVGRRSRELGKRVLLISGSPYSTGQCADEFENTQSLRRGLPHSLRILMPRRRRVTHVVRRNTDRLNRLTRNITGDVLPCDRARVRSTPTSGKNIFKNHHYHLTTRENTDHK